MYIYKAIKRDKFITQVILSNISQQTVISNFTFKFFSNFSVSGKFIPATPKQPTSLENFYSLPGHLPGWEIFIGLCIARSYVYHLCPDWKSHVRPQDESRMLSLKILIALKILSLSFPQNGRFILHIQKWHPNCFILGSIFLFSCDKLFDLICFSKLTVHFA